MCITNANIWSYLQLTINLKLQIVIEMLNELCPESKQNKIPFSVHNHSHIDLDLEM